MAGIKALRQSPEPGSYAEEQAEYDLSRTRGDTDRYTEALTQNDFVGGATPNSPAGLGAQGYTQFSSAGQQKYISGGSGSDGQAYNTGQNINWTTGNQNITATTFTAITGLSQPVAAQSYYFEGIFRVKQVNNTAGNVGFNGPSTTFTTWFYFFGINGSAPGNTPPAQGSLATVNVLGGTTGAEVYVWYRGMVTFSAAGTFSAGCIAAAGNTITAQPGCMFIVRPAT